MSINSENIVDDFLKKISESLPVGERDAYNAWKKEQEEKASHAASDRRAAAFERKLSNIAAGFAHYAAIFFRNEGISSRGEFVVVNDDLKRNDQIAIAEEDGRIFFYNTFISLIKSYKLDCKSCEDDGYHSVEITLYGKREKIGPLYGKLKNIGLSPVREVSKFTNTQGFNTNHLTVRFNSEELIEAVKKGLTIDDFTMAQWQ